MKVSLITFFVIIFFGFINSENIHFELTNDMAIIDGSSLFDNSTKNNDIIISTFMNESIITQEINCSNKKIIKYLYIKYEKCASENENNYRCINHFNNSCFTEVKINNQKFDKYAIISIPSLKNENNLIILDYIAKTLTISSNEANETISDNNLINEENLCYNGSIKNEKKIIFGCKLDYILFGHQDLHKDDVYLAKEIKEDNPIARLDNLLSYSIFPEGYLDYFYSSFFSELNDGCWKNEINIKDFKNKMFYITCPKKKINIYTKKRRLSVIINKFSYEIVNLFSNSFDFLENKNNDNYYFNILFEHNGKEFILGNGFFVNKTITIFDGKTYIYSSNRNNYTEDLTDINSEDFEKWLYILTTSSFTFLLLIFTVIGCIHSRKVNKELKEMLK